MDESTANYAVEPSKGPYALYVSSQEQAQVRDAVQQLPVSPGKSASQTSELLSATTHTSYSEGKETVG